MGSSTTCPLYFIESGQPKEQVIILEIKKTLREFEAAIQRAKKELETNEQELKEYLIQHKEELDIDIIRFYYWDTSLRTSIAADVLGLKTGSTLIGKATKNYWFKYKCCECGNDFKYFPKLGEVIDGKLIINGDRVCWKCTNKKRQHEQEEQHAKYKQDDEQRQKSYEQRLNALKYMPYAEYLQTDHWKEVSQRARKQ